MENRNYHFALIYMLLSFSTFSKFHVKRRECSLFHICNTWVIHSSFHFRAYDSSALVLNLCKTLHLGDLLEYQKRQIFAFSKCHVHGHVLWRPVICLTQSLKLSLWLVPVPSRHHNKHAVFKKSASKYNRARNSLHCVK